MQLLIGAINLLQDKGRRGARRLEKHDWQLRGLFCGT